MRLSTLFFIAMLIAQSARSTLWYASTNGAGSGTIGSPMDLQTLLTNASVVAGDTLYLRGGSYTHVPQATNCATCDQPGYCYIAKLLGASNNPVVMQSYPGEHAILDGLAYVHYAANARPTLQIGVSGSLSYGYITIQDIEVISSSTESRQAPDDSSFPTAINRSDGLVVAARGVKVINCQVHDTTAGISAFGTAAYGLTLYGNNVWNVGWQGTPNPHGHGLYMQGPINASGTVMTVNRNWFPGNYEKNNQIYGSSAAEVAHFRISENGYIGLQGLHGGVIISTRNGGAANRVQDDEFHDNFAFGCDLSFPNGGSVYADANAYLSLKAWNNYVVNSKLQVSSYKNFTFTNNYLIDKQDITFGNVVLETNDVIIPWNFDKNTYVFSSSGAAGFSFISFRNLTSWRAATGYDLNSTVTGTVPSGTNYVIVKSNIYNTNRANVIAFNWRLDNFIAVPVASLGFGAGTVVTVRNVQDYSTDMVSSTVTSTNTLVIDMRAGSHTVAVPFGASSALVTNCFPTFGGFVLEANSVAPPPPTTVTLTVNSTTPASGVFIQMSPADTLGQSNGNTPFTRTVTTNSVTTLTAPLAAADGSVFAKWTLNAVDYSTNMAVSFTNSANITMNAVFTPQSNGGTGASPQMSSRRRGARL